MPEFIINGSSKFGRFFAKESDGSLIETINLPQYNSGGLVERLEIKKIDHELIDYSSEQEIEGYIVHFVLHFEEKFSGGGLLQLKKVITYKKGNKNIFFTPRIDKEEREFEVVLTSDIIEVGILPGGANSVGHRLVMIEFRTRYLLPEIPWYVEPKTIITDEPIEMRT